MTASARQVTIAVDDLERRIVLTTSRTLPMADVHWLRDVMRKHSLADGGDPVSGDTMVLFEPFAWDGHIVRVTRSAR